MLDYLLSCIVCFLGIFVGYSLSKIAPEEMPEARKYFRLLQPIILCCVLGFVLYSYFGLLALLFSLVPLILLKYKINPRIIYIFLSLFLALGYYSDMSIVITALIFFFGFPIGSLSKDKSLKKIFAEYVHFVVICSVLYPLAVQSTKLLA